LKPYSSVKLGLTLNHSVFEHEVMKDTRKALALAKASLELAMNKIEEANEEEYREAKSIMEVIKENMRVWKEQEKGEDGEAIEDEEII